MYTLTTTEFALRLAAGAGCGALIGIERQWRARMAGLRTNALVAAGATLFVLYSVAVGDTGSPTRVASYVVSGIGFLGAGVILRDGFKVRGLNTAATLWCSAAIGVLAASGQFTFTGLATATVVVIHLLGRPLGRLIDHDVPDADEDLQAQHHRHRPEQSHRPPAPERGRPLGASHHRPLSRPRA
ncbi:putative Mg2+ transporter-C (MgtC) family protein [Streptosporangium album]|uniref:Putative Mg2+ transporter-C (MgtC) family protein n=1 Tax=Streptosporangium album TaxID=47479 RepID=A0A7W7RRH9_9ACTN|nr:MgtC/SapB family protein [Streptosporangium album]MBB4936819.1 putative Mg2+ transporter-C (MgtC) family protein [Streptosporangium album]